MKNSLKLLTLSSSLILLAGMAMAAPATVLFAPAGGQILNADGTTSALVRNATVNDSQTVQSGRLVTQLRFENGTQASVQPNSSLTLNGTGNNGENLFILSAGAVRVLGGNSVLETPFGKIEATGDAAYVASIVDGVLKIQVIAGDVRVFNAAGESTLSAGQAGEIASANQAPQEAFFGPETDSAASDGDIDDTASAKSDSYSIADNRNNSGGLAVTGGNSGGTSSGSITAPLNNGPYHIIYYGTEVGGAELRTPGTASFDNDGQLIGYSASMGQDALERNTNLTAELAGNEFVTIGRWNGGNVGGEYFGQPAFSSFAIPGGGGFHYAIGPISNDANLLSGSGTVQYNISAFTAPTFGGSGGATDGTFTGNLAVALGAMPKVGFNFVVAVGGDTYNLDTNGGFANPGASGVLVDTSNNTFNAFDGIGGGLTATSSANSRACPTGTCFANVAGFFNSDGGANAGIGYQIFNGSGGSDSAVGGAAILQAVSPP